MESCRGGEGRKGRRKEGRREGRKERMKEGMMEQFVYRNLIARTEFNGRKQDQETSSSGHVFWLLLNPIAPYDLPLLQTLVLVAYFQRTGDNQVSSAGAS